VLLVVSLVVPHSLLTTADAKSTKDSKARRDIDKSIGRAVEGKFSTVKTVNISTYAAPNTSLTVYNKTSSGSLPPIRPPPPEPQVCNKNEHLENGACIPDSTTPTAGYKVCMIGDLKGSVVPNAMKDCNYKIGLGDLGYEKTLSYFKGLNFNKCLQGNHESANEDGSASLEKETQAYCGNSWWVKFGDSTLVLAFNTNGDITKQLNAVTKLLTDSQFMSGVKNIIAISHKGGHVFPNAHHPAEAKELYSQLEAKIPVGLKLFEVNAHNHNAAVAPAKNWWISGNGGKSFYQCGNDKDWTFCNSKDLAYLQFNIDDNATITGHFIGTNGKVLY
jgi:hypothetical protein